MVPVQHEQDGPGGNNSGLDDLVRLRGSCELGLGANEERGTFLRHGTNIHHLTPFHVAEFYWTLSVSSAGLTLASKMSKTVNSIERQYGPVVGNMLWCRLAWFISQPCFLLACEPWSLSFLICNIWMIITMGGGLNKCT